MLSRSAEIAKEARSKFNRIISDARCAEFVSRFPLNRFWANEKHDRNVAVSMSESAQKRPLP
jgi:hypothetical protein